MPLITCPDCSHHPVSDRADACPKCGCPIRARAASVPVHGEVRQQRGTDRIQTGTLLVRRSIHDDEVPSATILIHSRHEDSSDNWVAHGSLDPGETLTIRLPAGKYRILASVGEYLRTGASIDDVDDSAELESEVVSASNVLLSTYAWRGSSLYVSLEQQEEFEEEDPSEYEGEERGLIRAGSAEGKRSPAELRSLREKAEAWVNGYTATAVGTVLATALIPGAATGILCTLEATMCLQIGKLYKPNFTVAEATAAAGTIGLAALAGKIAAMEAAILTGPVAFAVKPAIAGGIVKAMGQLVVNYFEEQT